MDTDYINHTTTIIKEFDNFKWDEDLSSIINKFLEKNKCDIISYRKANLYLEYVIVDGEGNLSKEKIESNNFIVNIFGINNRAYKKILVSHNQFHNLNSSFVTKMNQETKQNNKNTSPSDASDNDTNKSNKNNSINMDQLKNYLNDFALKASKSKNLKLKKDIKFEYKVDIKLLEIKKWKQIKINIYPTQ